MKHSIWKKKGYLWVTLALFLISLGLHLMFGWKAYVQEQESFGHAVKVSEFLVQWGRDVFENLQSEFLQLIWQVAGLAILWYAGSPQSKEGDDRKEEKLDYIVKMLGGEDLIKELDEKYPR
jgi:hypothetical protein